MVSLLQFAKKVHVEIVENRVFGLFCVVVIRKLNPCYCLTLSLQRLILYIITSFIFLVFRFVSSLNRSIFVILQNYECVFFLFCFVYFITEVNFFYSSSLFCNPFSVREIYCYQFNQVFNFEPYQIKLIVYINKSLLFRRSITMKNVKLFIL